MIYISKKFKFIDQQYKTCINFFQNTHGYSNDYF